MEETRENNIIIERKKEKKASEKHQQLANFIKGIHSQLRNDSEILGAEKAWEMHISQDENLKNYAESMYKLATEHWGQNSQDAEPVTFCRVEWIKNKCKDYYFNEGIKKYNDKEWYLLKKDIQESNINESVKKVESCLKTKISILDVGSCYNPFKIENTFSVTAIDIAPYSNDVLKCDFLKLKVDSKIKFADNERTLIELPKNSYMAVIFSLLLEYIPCPEQRFLCCKKAYDLLEDGGILFIATPDSKHEGSNAKIINTSWKVVLAKLGFMRICYEKLPHIHCMIYRKCFYKEVAVKKINWKKIPEHDKLYSSMKIFIPQDFQEKKPKNHYIEKCIKEPERNVQEQLMLFGELPFEI